MDLCKSSYLRCQPSKDSRQFRTEDPRPYDPSTLWRGSSFATSTDSKASKLMPLNPVCGPSDGGGKRPTAISPDGRSHYRFRRRNSCTAVSSDGIGLFLSAASMAACLLGRSRAGLVACGKGGNTLEKKEPRLWAPRGGASSSRDLIHELNGLGSCRFSPDPTILGA